MAGATDAVSGARPAGEMAFPGPHLLAAADFSALAGWRDDDLAAAFAAFRIGAFAAASGAPKTRALGIDGEALSRAASKALALPASVSAAEARRFFEAVFSPVLIAAPGFVTGYFEPEVAASSEPTD